MYVYKGLCVEHKLQVVTLIQAVKALLVCEIRRAQRSPTVWRFVAKNVVLFGALSTSFDTSFLPNCLTTKHVCVRE